MNHSTFNFQLTYGRALNVFRTDQGQDAEAGEADSVTSLHVHVPLDLNTIMMTMEDSEGQIPKFAFWPPIEAARTMLSYTPASAYKVANPGAFVTQELLKLNNAFQLFATGNINGGNDLAAQVYLDVSNQTKSSYTVDSVTQFSSHAIEQVFSEASLRTAVVQSSFGSNRNSFLELDSNPTRLPDGSYQLTGRLQQPLGDNREALVIASAGNLAAGVAFSGNQILIHTARNIALPFVISADLFALDAHRARTIRMARSAIREKIAKLYDELGNATNPDDQNSISQAIVVAESQVDDLTKVLTQLRSKVSSTLQVTVNQ